MAAVDIVKQPRILEHPLSDRSHSFTLAYTSVVIVGCGSLGSVSAGILAREGVGRICLIDDDRIEFANLSKQELYDVEDARLGQFKVLAAKEHLQRLNPYIIIEPVIERLSSQNAKQLISEADLVLDGTDNDFSRYAINQACHQQGIPWIFAAILEWYGLMMNIVPGDTPCFACAFGPSPVCMENFTRTKASKTTAHLVASLMVSQALRILLGKEGYIKGLMYVDAWDLNLEFIEIKSPQQGCPVCGRHDFD